MAIILHITKRDQWDQARVAGEYPSSSLHADGFIHCSGPDQVVGVADVRYRGEADLVLLCIDTNRVKAEIRYENLEGGDELFPHVYGPIELSAVAKVLAFGQSSEGKFTLPEELRLHGII